MPTYILRWTPVPAALIAAGFAWWVQLQALAAHRLQWAQDLAFFNQIFAAAAGGRAWTSSLLLEPTGFFEMVHFHPIFAALLPAYLIAPGPAVLLLFNTLAVAATALPLARLAADISGREELGLAAALSFLLWVPTWSAALADFRPMELLAPGLALAVWGAWARRRGWLLAGAALACSAREEASYLLVALGAALLLLPLIGWRRREGAALAAVGLAWFAFLVAFKDNFFFHFDPRTWPSAIGRGAPGPEPALVADRLRFIRESFLGGYLLAPLAPAALVASAPPLAFLWTDLQREWHAAGGLYVHLRAPLLGLWAAAGTAGAAWVVRRRPGLLWPLALGMLAGNLATFRPERAAIIERARALAAEAGSPEVAALNGLIARVRPGDRVGTDYRLIAALSGRRVLWNVAHLYARDARPPYWEVEWPLTLDRLDTLLVPEGDPVLAHTGGDWALEAAAGGYQLWRRRREPPGGFPEPLP